MFLLSSNFMFFVLSNYFVARLKRGFLALELFYVTVLIYASWILASKSWSSMETSASAWNQPTPVVIKTGLLVGSVLLAIQGLVHLLQLLGLARGDQPGDRTTESN